MTRGTLRHALGLGALALLLACKGPAVPHPLAGQSRYTCCNMHYEKPEITDANYQKGTLIPFGTQVQILEVRKNTVKFQPTGHPPIVLVLNYGKDAMSMDQFLDRTFVADDPHAKLHPAPTPAKKKGQRGSKAEPAATSKTEKLIDQGVVDVGMTRAQVLITLNYPPAHRTPSIDSPMWTYWQNRWVTFEVYFDGDKVSRVNR
jgi:hypothetical protein